MGVDVSVVIPTYNSIGSIGEVVERCRSLGEGNSVEIILVDDCSTDGTASKIQILAAEYADVRCVIHEKNLGQQRSLKDGFVLSQGRWVVTMDDDLQQKPEDIPKLLDKLQEGYDVVYGLPVRDGYPVHRALGSKAVDFFFYRFMNKPKDVKVGSYRIMRRWLVDKVVEDEREFVYITAIILEHTKNMANAPVSYRERPYGTSNYNWRKLMGLFFKLFIEYGWKRGKRP